MTQKLTLPIKVGKKYVRRDGVVVTAQAPYKEFDKRCCYVGTADKPEHGGGIHVWLESGRVSGHVEYDKPFDLVADYIEPAAAHPHAEAMLEYAKDAAQSITPWLNWEYKHPQTNWRELRDHPIWEISYGYRRKQSKVIINGIECVAGVKEPVFDELYYVASITRSDHCQTVRYSGAYQQYTERGLVHHNREDAIAMAKAMLNFQ